MAETARCKSCDSPIRWATMPTGKANPLDAEPTPDGNIAAYIDAKGDLRARALTRGEEPEPPERRGTSHFSTCPNAAAHRRRT